MIHRISLFALPISGIPLLSYSLVVILLLHTSCGMKKSSNSEFEGKLVYKITSPLDNPSKQDSTNYQVVYAMDSMLRIDSHSPIGGQTYIKHIPKNKAYILMDLPTRKVAIQTKPDTASTDSKYSFENKWGHDKIAGRKAQRAKVTDHDQDTTFVVNYLAEVPAKYSNALKGIPGLPVKYSIFSNGVWIEYRLIEIEEKPIDRDRFGIPSDHEIISLDEFIELLQKN